jgi:hypothetical protein
MKRAKSIMTRVMYVLGLGYLSLHIGMAPLALANDKCSTETLKGTYIFTQDGIETRAPSETQPAGDRRPFGYAGIETYDGDGNFTGINTLATARRPDQVPTTTVTEFLEYSGTYEVGSNCTVLWTSTDADGFTSNYHLFLAPDGSKFTFISVSAEVVNEDPNGNPVRELVQDIVGVGTAYRK